MTSTQDPPDMSDILAKLGDEIRRSSEQLTAIKGESAALQEENLLLKNESKKNNGKIQKLEKERDDLKRQVQRQRVELQTGSHGAGGTSGKAQPKDQEPNNKEDRNCHGGFVVLKEDHKDYRDIWDNSTFKDNGAALKQLSTSFPVSRMEVEVLSRHAWKLTQTVPAEEEWRVVNEEGESAEADDEEEPAKGAGDDDQSDIKSPRGQTFTSQRHGIELSGPRHDRLANTNLKRDAKRALPADFDYNSPHYRFKAICVRCWEGSSLCDFDGQCAACRLDKVKCVRKLCDAGLGCRKRRCPCLHPGQWDFVRGGTGKDANPSATSFVLLW